MQPKNLVNLKKKKKLGQRFSCWSNGYESTLQCKGCGRRAKIPWAEGEPSPCTAMKIPHAATKTQFSHINKYFFKKEKLSQFDEKSNRTGIEPHGSQTIFSGHFSFLSLLSRASWLPGVPNLAVNSPGEFTHTDLVPAQDIGRSEFLTWAESSFNPVLSPWAGDNLILPVSSLDINGTFSSHSCIGPSLCHL